MALSLSALHLAKRQATCQRAAYILFNNPSGNSIPQLAISTADGTLSMPNLTPTGGKNLLDLDAGGAPAGPDGLFSQGAVTFS